MIKMIQAENYRGESVQWAGYYVLHVTSSMPKPDVFFVEEDKKGETNETKRSNDSKK